MDIYGAKNNIEKLENFVLNLSEEYKNKSMYKSSKDRLMHIAKVCRRIMHYIYAIVEEDSLLGEFHSELLEEVETDSIEPRLKMNNDLYGTILNMYDDLKSTERFLSMQPEDRKIIRYEMDQKKATEDTMHVYTTAFKVIRECIEKGAVEKYPKYVQDAFELIYFWYENRFLDNLNPDFRFSVIKLPSNIVNIVLSLGDAAHSNILGDLKSNFIEWRDDIILVQSFALMPSSINDYVLSGYPPERITTEALVIWEALSENGLDLLGDLHIAKMPNSLIHNIYKKHHSQEEYAQAVKTINEVLKHNET